MHENSSFKKKQYKKETIVLSLFVLYTHVRKSMKMNHSDIFWPQTLVNKVRIVNLLVVQSLELGFLVASVKI